MTRPRCLVPTPFALAALSAMAAPAPTSAQDLTYFTTTTMEVSSALREVLTSLAKVDDPIVERVCFKGARVRKDQDQTSSIMDWSSGALTFLDHSDRTFLRFDFTQMAGALRESPPRRDSAEGPPIEVTRTTTRTVRKDDIGGYAAEQVVLVVELRPQNAEGPLGTHQAATALVTDLWLSSEFPEYRLTREMAPEALALYRLGGGPAGVATALHALSGPHAALARGWEKSVEAVGELEGTVLRSVTHFVVIPPGAALDRARVLATPSEQVEEIAGLAQGVAHAARQVVIMRVRMEISGVSTDAVAESVFDIPPGYRERGARGGG